MRLAYRLTLLALPALAGCAKPGLPECISGGGRGGETASVGYIATPDRLFVVWSDISFDEHSVGGSSGRGPGYARVAIFGAGRAVEMKVWTEDGKNLRMAVNGGSIAVATTTLVRTRAGRPR